MLAERPSLGVGRAERSQNGQLGYGERELDPAIPQECRRRTEAREAVLSVAIHDLDDGMCHLAVGSIA